MDERNRFSGLFDVVAELNRMREQVRHPDTPAEPAHGHGIAWIPVTDIFVRGQDIVIRCELAGLGADDVELSFAGHTLTIWAERTGAPDEEASQFYVRERRFGTGRRTIDLPDGVETGDISAVFEDGLLEVTVACAAAAREPEQVEIRTAGKGRVKLMGKDE
jgi:HSP20 family protein